jgi:hypothetical protein
MSNILSIVTFWGSALLLTLSACVPTQVETENVTIDTPSFPLNTSPVTHTSTPTLLEDISPATFTPAPTLSDGEAYSLLTTWLQQNNNDCQLPCWGGLAPGTSLTLEAYNTLIPLRSIGYFEVFYPTGGTAFIIYPSDDLEININVGIHSESDGRSIQLIRISTYTLRKLGPGNYEEVYDALVSNQLLQGYALNEILSKYGVPAEVWVRADIYNTGTQETFSITLLYPDKGIFVRYNMPAERISDQIRGCPSRSFVDLWLLSPEDVGDYQEMLLSKNVRWEGNWPYTTPIQESTSLTIGDFYQTFKEPTDMCLETPLIIWPEH